MTGGKGNDLAFMLDGVQGTFTKGENPLSVDPNATASIAGCTFSTPIEPGSKEFSVDCPIVGGVNVSVDDDGKLDISGSVLGGLVTGKLSDLDSYRPQLSGDACICDWGGPPKGDLIR